MKYNPFMKKENSNKEVVRDPLDVRELLTNGSRKAVITESGEIKLDSGNTEEQPSLELMKERYWGGYSTLFNERIAFETRAMHKSFPQFELRRLDKRFFMNSWNIAEKSQMCWVGKIKTYSQTNYVVAIVYPKDYPFSEPRAYVLQPFIPATEHRFKDGHLCLYEHEGRGQGFESGKTTAVTVVGWTSAWLHAYEIWRKTGNWPILEEQK